MSFSKNKLTKAITLALAGSALSVAAISDASATATTMYNLTTSGGADNSSNTTICAPCIGDTDGWLYGKNGTSNGTDTSVAKWAGTTGTNKTPFGYTGAHLNWGLHFTSYDSAEISSQDSLTRYGVAADIDTAKGAWSDNSSGLIGDSGWRHDLDMGLFKSDTGGTITLSTQGVNQSGTNFGFTIFKGMSTNASYSHHGDWNAFGNANGVKSASLPGGGTTFTVADIVAYSVGGANPSNLNTISFAAEAGQVYTIAIGGYRNGSWGDTIDGYKLNVSTSPVPVPGAVWLFGSAMAGLVGFGRRRQK